MTRTLWFLILVAGSLPGASRGDERIEVQAVGLHTKRLWNKLLKAEDFGEAVKITQAGELAALTGKQIHANAAFGHNQ